MHALLGPELKPIRSNSSALFASYRSSSNGTGQQRRPEILAKKPNGSLAQPRSSVLRSRSGVSNVLSLCVPKLWTAPVRYKVREVGDAVHGGAPPGADSRT